MPPKAKPDQFAAMISSTALDLPDHRAAVKEACIAARVFPIGMEYLPARDVGGVDVSLEMVDRADIYLGIYAWRYGWVPDGKGISVTEMEFDHAVGRKEAGDLSQERELQRTPQKFSPRVIRWASRQQIPGKRARESG